MFSQPAIDPDKVDLIVFDVDGTLSVTITPVYESFKRAFTVLGIPFTLTGKDIEQHLGKPASDFYRALTPPDCSIPWQEIRRQVAHEEQTTFFEFGKTFPGVKETLQTLRQRGYTLAVFSNAVPSYFNTVISALGISDCFDYKECVGENDLSKSELLRKIIDRFGNPGTAVIGDRSHDIEAAGENDALSIGCVYGYGGDEPQQADITIDSFPELLSVFDRKYRIFKNIVLQAGLQSRGTGPRTIGITGIDASGKTTFTEAFETWLKNSGRPVQVIHIDDFHNPTSIRYKGENEADNYFNKSFDIRTLTDTLLKPARAGFTSIELTTIDLATDRYENTIRYHFSPNTIVILEGVFLFREEIVQYLDYSVYLDISFEESLKRGLKRGGEKERYEIKYLPAQKRYLQQYPPEKHADMIIDTTDHEYPKITFQR